MKKTIAKKTSVKKTMACLGVLAIYVLLGLGFTAWFFLQFPISPGQGTLETSSRIKYALGGGFLVAIPALFALDWLRDGWLRVHERVQMARASEGGLRLPAEGEWGVFYGPIHRDGPPLTAPLTRRDCLLYRYEISHQEIEKTSGSKSMYKDDTSKSPRTVVDAEGFALTPSTIRTAGGPVKLLTLVTPEFKPDRFSSFDKVGENYKAYVATTTLRDRTLRKDATGAIRYDLGTGKPDPKKNLWIQEHIVQHGDNVVVFGRYSAARGEIAPDPVIAHDPNIRSDTRLRKGSLEALKRRLALDAIGCVVVAILWCAVAAAGTWVFFRFGPTDIWN